MVHASAYVYPRDGQDHGGGGGGGGVHDGGGGHGSLWHFFVRTRLKLQNSQFYPCLGINALQSKEE